MPDSTNPQRVEQLNAIIGELEELNHEAKRKNIWIRTKWNSANQKPWHTHESGAPAIGEHGLPLEHARPVPHIWKWAEFEPYLRKVADLCPLELTERQSILLINPALKSGYKVCNTIRIAISIYKSGDNAVPHMHSPNASRTILSRGGGYTLVEGERCPAYRGDLILTPNGTWHAHGNDDPDPVIWADTLDWPLMDYLGCVWVRGDHQNAKMNDTPDEGHSKKLYGNGGIVPRFKGPKRGVGQDVSEMFYYAGADVRQALKAMKDQDGDAHEGIIVEFVNPVNGKPVFPTIAYKAQLLRPGESTLEYRHTANSVYSVVDGSGVTEVDGKRLEWTESDFFVCPSHMWRKHTNTSKTEDAILYSYSDSPLIQAVGHYRAQGKTRAGSVIELAD
jgi:gentisate 1,2-dioxygenase